MLDINNNENRLEAEEEKALKILSKIVETISYEAKIKKISSEKDYTIFEIINAESAIIIGRHGHTLDAIQYMVNLIANKGNKDNHRVYVVDIDGYRKRREESLQRYAKEKAEIVKRKGSPVPLYFMNSIERRLIHMALKDDIRVTTASEGREPYRRVIIKPAINQNLEQ